MISELGNLAPLFFTLLLLPGSCIWVVRSAVSATPGRHGAIGIRTRHTTASDDAWTAGHTAALPLVTRTMPVGSVAVITAALVQMLAGGHSGIAVTVAALVGEVVLLLLAARAADRAAQSAVTGS